MFNWEVSSVGIVPGGHHLRRAAREAEGAYT